MSLLGKIFENPENQGIRLTQGLSAMMNKMIFTEKFETLVFVAATIATYRRLIDAHQPLLKMLREFVDETISLAMAKSESKPACKKGCSACCHQVVLVSSEEAGQLISHVTADVIPRWKAQAIDLRTHNDPAGLPKRLGKEDAKCVFLKRGECSVYDIRPVMCRLIHVKNATACDPWKTSAEAQQLVSVRNADIAVSAYLNATDIEPMPILLEKVE